MKPQAVRLLDVFLFGPLIGLGGALLMSDDMPHRRVLGAALLAVGTGTSIYNGANYLSEAAQRAASSAGRAPNF